MLGPEQLLSLGCLCLRQAVHIFLEKMATLAVIDGPLNFFSGLLCRVTSVADPRSAQHLSLK